jgi:hypothetical protein
VLRDGGKADWNVRLGDLIEMESQWAEDGRPLAELYEKLRSEARTDRLTGKFDTGPTSRSIEP